LKNNYFFSTNKER